MKILWKYMHLCLLHCYFTDKASRWKTHFQQPTICEETLMQGSVIYYFDRHLQVYHKQPIEHSLVLQGFCFK